MASFPASWIAFELVEDCGPDGCYGDGDTFTPQLIAGVVFLSLLIFGRVMLQRSTEPDRWAATLRVYGWTLVLVSLPLGLLAADAMAAAFCPPDCAGDYSVMLVEAWLSGLGISLALVVMGWWAIFRARRLNHQNQGGCLALLGLLVALVAVVAVYMRGYLA